MIGRVRALAVLVAAVAVVTIATTASGQDVGPGRAAGVAPTAPPITIPEPVPSAGDGSESGGSAEAAGAASGDGDPVQQPVAVRTTGPAVQPTGSPTTPSTTPSSTPSTPASTPSGSDGESPGSTTGSPGTSPAPGPPTTPAGDPAPSTPPGTPSTAPGDRRVLLGASGPDRPTVEALDAALGRQVRGLRVYRRWGEPLLDPTARWAVESGRTLFLSVRARYPDGTLIPFSAVGGATPGSALHTDMLRFAEEVKAFPGTLYLTFNHEPDADPENGDAAAFAAAWRTWVGTLRTAGVTNARFVWTVTAFGFTRTDDRAAPLYWPGDDVVDVIGVDGYNAYACLQPNGPWRSPAEVFGAAFGWAAQRHPGVPVALMEWSSVEDPAVPDRKARWLADLATLVAATPSVIAILQWGGGGVLPVDVPGCDYALATSDRSLAGWRDLGLLPLLSAAFPEPA